MDQLCFCISHNKRRMKLVGTKRLHDRLPRCIVRPYKRTPHPLHASGSHPPREFDGQDTPISNAPRGSTDPCQTPWRVKRLLPARWLHHHHLAWLRTPKTTRFERRLGCLKSCSTYGACPAVRMHRVCVPASGASGNASVLLGRSLVHTAGRRDCHYYPYHRNSGSPGGSPTRKRATKGRPMSDEQQADTRTVHRRTKSVRLLDYCATC